MEINYIFYDFETIKLLYRLSYLNKKGIREHYIALLKKQNYIMYFSLNKFFFSENYLYFYNYFYNYFYK
mgnify:CR=1